MKKIYDKKFSIPHYDSMPDDDWYLRAFENSSEQYKKEVYDIYFGATFSSTSPKKELDTFSTAISSSISSFERDKVILVFIF